MNIGKFLFSTAKTKVGSYIVGKTFESFSKLLPVLRVYENDLVIAFWHPKPFWEKHILIIPKKAIKSMTTISDADMIYINEVYKTVKTVIGKLEWTEYTLLTNGGQRQEVNQLHFHLCSGKEVYKSN